MFIILLGAPGAGKGTQSKRIAEKYSIPHISTGDIFRNLSKVNSELSNKVKEILDSGNLVPDDLTSQIVKSRLEEGDCASGWLLDGFPRNIYQAEFLTKLLGDQINDTYCILLDVPDYVILERIKLRSQVSGRKDDDDSVAQKRLEIYREQTEPLIHYYKGLDRLSIVDGNCDMDEVFHKITEILGNK